MIGMIDSGLGGLLIARQIGRFLPNLDIVYVADTAHAPYGLRSARAVREHALRSAQYLMKAGAHLLVLSSHTVASVAGVFLQESLNVPVLSVSQAAITAAVAASPQKRFGVIASPATVDSFFFEENIQRHCVGAKVYAVAAPLLIALVEEGWIKKPETHMMVKKHLHPLITRQIDTLILGSNHLSILKKTIARKSSRRIGIVEGVAPFARRIKEFVAGSEDMALPADRKGGLRVVVTEKTAHHEKTARMFWGGHVTLSEG